VHLKKGVPVKLRIALGLHEPLDWVAQVNEA
jgi:hypothetical protein